MVRKRKNRGRDVEGFKISTSPFSFNKYKQNLGASDKRD
jgi:hypothetical protein